MNEIKKSTFMDRIRRAWRAFCDKPTDRIVVGFEVKRCSECEHRKQKEGEWVWTENGEADCEKYWVCSACKEHDFVKTKYCPNCGAKMKGGAE